MLQLYIAIALDLNPSLVTGELEVNAFLGCEWPIIVHHSHILNLSQKKKKKWWNKNAYYELQLTFFVA